MKKSVDELWEKLKKSDAPAGFEPRLQERIDSGKTRSGTLPLWRFAPVAAVACLLIWVSPSQLSDPEITPAVISEVYTISELEAEVIEILYAEDAGWADWMLDDEAAGEDTENVDPDKFDIGTLEKINEKLV